MGKECSWYANVSPINREAALKKTLRIRKLDALVEKAKNQISRFPDDAASWTSDWLIIEDIPIPMDGRTDGGLSGAGPLKAGKGY